MSGRELDFDHTSTYDHVGVSGDLNNQSITHGTAGR